MFTPSNKDGLTCRLRQAQPDKDAILPIGFYQVISRMKLKHPGISKANHHCQEWSFIRGHTTNY
jgi:hypothetical protein